jgi:hypothetical protein
VRRIAGLRNSDATNTTKKPTSIAEWAFPFSTTLIIRVPRPGQVLTLMAHNTARNTTMRAGPTSWPVRRTRGLWVEQELSYSSLLMKRSNETVAQRYRSPDLLPSLLHLLYFLDLFQCLLRVTTCHRASAYLSPIVVSRCQWGSDPLTLGTGWRHRCCSVQAQRWRRDN